MVRAGVTPSEVEEKPVVKMMVVWPAPEEILDAIRQGLEEEGIPVEWHKTDHESAAGLAYQGALASRLNVGVGLNWAEGEAVVHHRELPADEPLLILRREKSDLQALRILGANAARLVKGDPLILEAPYKDGLENQSDQDSSTDNPDTMFEYGGSSASLEEIIKRVLKEVLTDSR
jgi:hypothetical protein